MNDKEKEILKKLFKIAENQQKVIQKLAQAQSSDPSYYAEETPENKFDPLRVDPSMAPVNYNQAPGKAPDWLDQYMDPNAVPVKTTGTPGVASSLPEGVKEMIDKGAPALKNNLMLNFNGKNVGVRYNRNALNYKPEAVHTLLTNALPGYKVEMPVGESGNMNLLNDWHPNY